MTEDKCALCVWGKYPRIVIGDGPDAVHNVEGVCFVPCEKPERPRPAWVNIQCRCRHCVRYVRECREALEETERRLARQDMEDKLRDQIMNGGDR